MIVDDEHSDFWPRLRRTVFALIASIGVATTIAAAHAGSLSRTPGSEFLLVARLNGRITEGGGAPVAQARVTLFTPNLSSFQEVRSLANGAYSFRPALPGIYRLGVAKLGRAYQEIGVTVAFGANVHNFVLAPETAVGSWNVIGNTLPETFDATDIGVLRTDGTIMYCHDTVAPVLFDPRTGVKAFPAGTGSAQGCMNTTLLADGSVIVCGGQDGDQPGNFVNGIPWVKRFWPNNTWTQLGNMLLGAGRWYPGLARLNDGRLLIMGGGMSPDATRTDTCELFNPATQTWSWTDTMNSPLEFPPCGLLYNGKVLRTWGTRPELYDVPSGTWSDTGDFVFNHRGFPGHSDHSMIVLSDGRAVAVGVNRNGQAGAVMTEYYDPSSGAWSVGTNPSLVRMQAEVVYLPDGQILVAAGDKQSTGGSEPNVLGVVKRCDLFEPIAMSWRRVADLAWFREYHAVTLLVPDGRVVTTGGTTIKFQYGPTSADIEAYSPPYLFRGVRPQIANLSDTTPQRGDTVGFDVFPATKLTSAVLMGVQSTTHWVDGGIPRRLVLPVTQKGLRASVVVPTDANQVPLGWYMLFGLVDDIPSVGLIVRVDP